MGFKFNPEVPITNSDIHGITDEMVKDCPVFADCAKAIHARLENVDLCGFNLGNFDLQIIDAEFERCGIEWDISESRIIDVGMIYKKQFPRDLSACVLEYCGREHTGAHGAKADVDATHDCLTKMLIRYPELCDDVATAAHYSTVNDRDGSVKLDLAGTVVKKADGKIVFGTKRNRDVEIRNELSYAEWILRSDFPRNTIKVLRAVIEDIYAEREKQDMASAGRHEGGLF